MSADIIRFRGITKLDLPASQVIERSLDANLNSAVVIGYDQDGDFYFASTHADGAEVLWLLELAKHKLLRIGGGDE